MPKLIIDGAAIEVEDGLTLIQACEMVGVEIPRFCYHERLDIAGNCRMCLVEVEKAPKLVASCAMPVSDGMVVHTNSEKVTKAREGVLEFLLINHPLDCPICDEAGECDLQDQAFKYGRPANRFSENKRSVTDKYMGPLINTKMTRCIHCTRCVRFSEDVAGIQEIGSFGRGEHMEISTYLEKSLDSELSGNIIDLCPVGALTSKPYAFKARSWELKKTPSIDVMDALGSNIQIDSRGLEVMRILPRINEDINEEWISDKARFSYDGLKIQRLDRPYIRKNGKFVEVGFEEAISVIASKIKSVDPSKIGAIAGTLCDVESLYALKKFMHLIGSCNIDVNEFGYKFDVTSRGNYLFNTTISGISDSDLCLLIGANPRVSAPVLNAKIGKAVRASSMEVYAIGQIDNQTYPINNLGSDIKILSLILEGKHDLCKELEKAKNPMIIIGSAVYSRSDSLALQKLIYDIAIKYNVIKENWNGFNILHNHASTVGALDIGFLPKDGTIDAKKMIDLAKNGEFGVIYLLSADEIDISDLENCFVIYQGHHGDKNASFADVILPSAAYTEKDAIYVNLEGRPQVAYGAVSAPGKAKEDWKVILDLAIAMDKNIAFKTLDELRNSIAAEHNIFTNFDKIIDSEVKFGKSSGKILKSDITKVDMNFYMTNSISRASVTMAKCTEEKRKRGEV